MQVVVTLTPIKIGELMIFYLDPLVRGQARESELGDTRTRA
jgi:hypothetical protein